MCVRCPGMSNEICVCLSACACEGPCPVPFAAATPAQVVHVRRLWPACVLSAVKIWDLTLAGIMFTFTFTLEFLEATRRWTECRRRECGRERHGQIQGKVFC